jgi:hypothetical protein
MKPRILLITVGLIILTLLISLCLFVYLRISLPVSNLRKEASKLNMYKDTFANLKIFMTGEEIKQLRTMVNDYHVEMAKKFGVDGLVDDQAVHREVKNGRLVSISDSRFWRIKELEDSLPFITKDNLKFLQILGKRFHENLKKQNLPLYRFTISSLLRTEQTQQRLTRKNQNATKGISSHQFGTTVDILFKDFEYTGEDQFTYFYLIKNANNPEFKKADFDKLGEQYSQYLKTILAETLLQLQKEGKCLVIYEKRQPVFHVTIARKF